MKLLHLLLPLVPEVGWSFGAERGEAKDREIAQKRADQGRRMVRLVLKGGVSLSLYLGL